MALVDWARARLDVEWEDLEQLGEDVDVLVARGVAGREAIAVVRAAASDGMGALILTGRAWELLEPRALTVPAGAIAPPATERVAELREGLVALEEELGRPLAEMAARLDPFELEELLAGELAAEDLNLDEGDGAEVAVGGVGLRLAAPRRAHTVEAAWSALTPSGRVEVVVAKRPPAALLGAVGFGGFNDCPDPPAQVSRWTEFAARWGAIPVLVDGDRLEALAARPPRTLDEVALLAATLLEYDRDLLQDLTPVPIACGLWGSTVWRFWWD